MIPFAVKKALYYSYKKGIAKMLGCLFCQIVQRQKPAAIFYEDEKCMAFRDIRPQAPVHFLVIPRKHFSSLNDIGEGDEDLIGHLFIVAARMAKEKGIASTGYRTVINTNAEAGQTVFHLHLHVMGQRRMTWPPG